VRTCNNVNSYFRGGTFSTAASLPDLPYKLHASKGPHTLQVKLWSLTV